MIISEEKEQLHSLNKIIKEKHKHIYRMRPDGLLEYDGNYLINKFLVYIDGKWYASKEYQQGASEGILEAIETRKFLFAITESRYWQIREDRQVEYASPGKPLSGDAIMFFAAEQKGMLCLYVIDGSKNNLPLMLGVPKEPDSEKIFIQAVIAMTHQYNPEAAKEMEDFWFAEPTPIEFDEKPGLCRWDLGIESQDIYIDDYPYEEE